MQFLLLLTLLFASPPYQKDLKDNSINEARLRYNAVVNDYNDGVDALDDYVIFHNERFLPMRPDSVITGMLAEAFDKLTAAKSKLGQIPITDREVYLAAQQLSSEIDDALRDTVDSQLWLSTIYLPQSTGHRRNIILHEDILHLHDLVKLMLIW